MSKITVCHDPRECRDALAGATSPVAADLETTGLMRSDAIVSAGFLVGDTAYILFVRARHATVRNHSRDCLVQTLQPLSRKDLVLVGHNFGFDLGFLVREGIEVNAQVIDTLKLLRLLDQDRGGDREERRRPRLDRRAPAGARLLLDYKLKNATAQLLGIRPLQFPGSMESAPYPVHARYLASDLLATRLLFEHLWGRLDQQLRHYYHDFVKPLQPLLTAMSEYGVQADAAFIEKEAGKLEAIRQRLSKEHRHQHGVLLGMKRRQLVHWLFDRRNLGLPRPLSAGWRDVSLTDSALRRLRKEALALQLPAAANSLDLLRDYRRASSLLVRLRSLARHVEPRTGRIHSVFDDRQASGRVSSRHPNLQQLANTKKIAGKQIVTRNAIIAGPGKRLVVADISQADLRVLANAVESFPLGAVEYLDALRRERHLRLQGQIDPYLRTLAQCRNPNYRGQPLELPDFDPSMPGNLHADFLADRDIYAASAQRVLGHEPTPEDRKKFKPLVLGQVNGQGAPSLARAMNCTPSQARDFLDAFATAYVKETAYAGLMHWQIAITGQTRTFAGRLRTDTPHRWMVTLPHVEILVAYRQGDAYWLEIAPLEPGRRVLTSYVLRAWDARRKPRRLIYDHRRGRLSRRPYRLFDDDDFLYRLPCRNWSWRSIRRVRANGEEAQYLGLDATCRSLFNFIAQGGTADVTKGMMLRSQEVCRRFDARLLLQVHDELVFDVPAEKAEGFQAAVQPILEAAPSPHFRVPIKIKIVVVERFADAKEG